MSTTTWIALLWLGFAASHLLLTSVRVRPRVVARIGEPMHRGIFSLIALAFSFPALALYLTNRHAGATLWTLPSSPPLDLALYAGSGLGLLLMVLGLVQRSPTMMGVGGRTRVRGALRVTRHPLVMGFALVGLFQLILGGRGTDVAFFGGLVAFSLVGAWHQDRRYLHDDVPGYREFYQQTRFLPFGPRPTKSRRHEVAAVGG